MDRGVRYYTQYLRRHLQTEVGVDDPRDLNVAFRALTTPLRPSVFVDEIMEWQEIVDTASEQTDSGDLSLERLDPKQVRFWLGPQTIRPLVRHWRKWRFLGYHGYSNRETYSVGFYFDRLAKELRAVAEDRFSYPAGIRDEDHDDAAFRYWSEKLRIDEGHLRLFRAYPEVGRVKAYRRYTQLRNFYYLDEILSEIALRTRLTEGLLRNLRPEEIVSFWEGDRSFATIAADRSQGCTYFLRGSSERIFADANVVDTASLLAGPAGDNSTLRGDAVSEGLVGGVCRVVIRKNEADEGLPPGTVLVSQSTDPDLLELIKQSVAVLTEQGGVASHAALVCRELGIPAIVGIQGLLDVIRDGDVVEVDAFEGVVEVKLNAAVEARRRHHAILSAADSVDERIMGSKAARLLLCRQLGFAVPNTVVLSASSVCQLIGSESDSELSDLADEILARLHLRDGDSVIVRSSALSEDNIRSSNAGRYASIPSVNPHFLTDGLRSFCDANEVLNGSYHGGILVQEMVRGEVGGVALSNVELTQGGSAIVVECSVGSPVVVTSGVVAPYRLVISRETGDIIQQVDPGSLSEDIGRSWLPFVLDVLERLENAFRFPVDCEWIFSDWNVTLLQVRPIAHAHEEPSR